jgi:NADP-dependent 3-hydroxy acid dehydrogenase YdfG
MGFDGVRVLVTGGGSGIGLAVTRAFLAQGAAVVVAGRDGGRLREAKKELNSDRLHTHTADVSDPHQAKGLIEAAARQLGDLDVLVNNAGTNVAGRSMRELTVENWQLLIKGNLDSAFYCTHAALPRMLERKSGLIVNISSVAGRRALPLSGAGYSAAKFGMSALGLCLAAEERESGIRVTNIYPGEVVTPILWKRAQPPTPEQLAKLLQPEDVAAAVLFVAGLPPRAHVPELVIKPVTQFYL